MQRIESFLIGRHVRLFEEGTQAIAETLQALPEAKKLAVKVLHKFDPGDSIDSDVISESDVQKAFLLKELRRVLDLKQRRRILERKRNTMESNMEIAFDDWDPSKVRVSQVNTSSDAWEYKQIRQKDIFRRQIITREQVTVTIKNTYMWSSNSTEPYYTTAILEKEPRQPWRVRLPLGFIYEGNSSPITAEIKNGKLQKPSGVSPRVKNRKGKLY